MKKFISIALTAIMLLGLIPMSVFAAGEAQTVTYGNAGTHTLTALDNEKLADTSATYVCRIGDGTSAGTTTYYTSLKAAYDALPAGNDASAAPSSITVTLIADLTEGDLAGSKAMIVEGNGFSFNKFTTRAFTWTNADLTVKNLTMNSSTAESRSVQFHPNSSSIKMDVAFVNCTIISKNINVDLRGSDNSDTKHTISFDNCYVEATSSKTGQNSYAIYGNHGKTADWDITVNNSKMSCKNSNETSGNPNCAIGLHNAGDISLDLKGNTVIEAATKSNTYGNYGIGVFQAANVSLKLASTVSIELNVPDGLDVVSTFIHLNKGTVTDNGAAYKANANAAKGGVVVPMYGPAPSSPTKTLVGYATEANSSVYTELGKTYTGDAAVTFYPVYGDAVVDDSAAIAEGNVAKTDVNGDGYPEYYKTVQAAVAAIPAGAHLDGMTDAEKAKHTVTLLCDIGDAGWGTGGGDAYFAVSSALIFDGNGNDVILGKHNATTPSFYTAFEVVGVDIVIQNIPKFECGRIARVRCNVDDVDVTVKNCNVTVFDCMGLYLTSTNTSVKNVTGYVTVDNSSIITKGTMDGNNASPIFTHYDNQCGDINWVINVNNSTLAQEGTNISSYDSVITAHTGEDLEINLTGNTVIRIAGGTIAEPSNKNHYGIYVANSHSDNEVKINVASTVKFETALPTTTTTGNVVFIQAPSGTKYNILGELKAGAEALKLGVVLPAGAADNGKIFTGWANGDETIAPAEVYTKADATAAVIFTPNYIDQPKFEMNKGASLKTDGTIGIRFSAVADGTLNTLYGDNVTFGVLIAMYDTSLTADTFKKGEISSSVAYLDLRNIGVETDANGDTVIYGCLVNLPETLAGVKTEFTARAYYTIDLGNGNKQTVYADWSAEDNVRSAYEVAVAASAAEGSNASYDKILQIGGAQ